MYHSLVAAQHYDTDINKEYVIRHNAAILRCVLPSYLTDWLHVISWKIDEEELTYTDTNYGIIIRLHDCDSWIMSGFSCIF